MIVERAGEGHDTVIATVSWVLGANLEDLVLDEDSGDINGTGNAQSNVIFGNSGNNTLDGGAGADVLGGGGGDDVYIVDKAGDLLMEFEDEGIDNVISSIG